MYFFTLNYLQQNQYKEIGLVISLFQFSLEYFIKVNCRIKIQYLIYLSTIF